MTTITSPLPMTEYKSRMSAFRKEGDKFRGIVCCSPDKLDDANYVEIEWPELADTEAQAMIDAAKVQFALDEQPDHK